MDAVLVSFLFPSFSSPFSFLWTSYLSFSFCLFPFCPFSEKEKLFKQTFQKSVFPFEKKLNIKRIETCDYYYSLICYIGFLDVYHKVISVVLPANNPENFSNVKNTTNFPLLQ